jgi:hypothetical protein
VNHLSEGSATELQANLPLYDSSLFKQILPKLPLIAVKAIFDFDQTIQWVNLQSQSKPNARPSSQHWGGLVSLKNSATIYGDLSRQKKR